jgi:hypothetical protein
LRDLIDDLALTARRHLLFGKRLISIIQTDRQDNRFDTTSRSASLNPAETRDLSQ